MASFLDRLRGIKSAAPIMAELDKAQADAEQRDAAIKVFADCEREETKLPPLRSAVAAADAAVAKAQSLLEQAIQARVVAIIAHDGIVSAIESRRRRARVVLRSTVDDSAIRRYIDRLDDERTANVAAAFASQLEDTGKVNLWSGNRVLVEWSNERTGRLWFESLCAARSAALALVDAPLTPDEIEAALAAIESQRFPLSSVKSERIGKYDAPPKSEAEQPGRVLEPIA